MAFDDQIPMPWSSIVSGATQPRNSTAVKKEMLWDDINVLYRPSTDIRRSRTEWPTLDDHAWSIIQCPTIRIRGRMSVAPYTIPESALQVLNDELARCDTSTGFSPDRGVFDLVYRFMPYHRKMFRNLYWRVRRQSAVWQMFNKLYERGFINLQCLLVPCDVFSPSLIAYKVHCVLTDFTFPIRDGNLLGEGVIPLQSYRWDYDLIWLAIMIIRGGVQLDKLFEDIELIEIFGYFSEYYICEPVTVPNDPVDSRCTLPEIGTTDIMFGFWLPHGIRKDRFISEIHACERRWNAIERAFCEAESSFRGL